VWSILELIVASSSAAKSSVDAVLKPVTVIGFVSAKVTVISITTHRQILTAVKLDGLDYAPKSNFF